MSQKALISKGLAFQLRTADIFAKLKGSLKESAMGSFANATVLNLAKLSLPRYLTKDHVMNTYPYL